MRQEGGIYYGKKVAMHQAQTERAACQVRHVVPHSSFREAVASCHGQRDAWGTRGWSVCRRSAAEEEDIRGSVLTSPLRLQGARVVALGGWGLMTRHVGAHRGVDVGVPLVV